MFRSSAATPPPYNDGFDLTDFVNSDFPPLPADRATSFQRQDQADLQG